MELSAEATVQGDEDWLDAQSELYQELGKQVRSLWLKGQKPLEGPEKAAEDIPVSSLTGPHQQQCLTTIAWNTKLGTRGTSAVPTPGTATRPLTGRGAGKPSPIDPRW